MKLALRVLAGLMLTRLNFAMAADATALKSFTEQIPGTQVRFEMIAVPGGEFLMGSPPSENGRKADEGPQVRVRMDPFCIGKFSVTWPEYQEFMTGYQRLQINWREKRVDPTADAVTYPTPMYDLEFGPRLLRMGGRKEGMPAVAMSQFAARQYTKWLSKKTGRFYRLATEAEWEYACRAGTTTTYCFGDDPMALDAFGWSIENSNVADGNPGYHRVGQKKPNAWGLYDMHGNVGQWCFDAYDANWYAKFAGKTVDWHEVINWPTRRYPCVIRGGSYESERETCRSATRMHSTKDLNAFDPGFPKSPYWESDGPWLGFRLACPPKEPDEAEKLKFWDPAPDDAATNDSIRRDRDAHEILPAAPRQ
jgi:formylglycine-generating enzyme required for sulfatase activity